MYLRSFRYPSLLISPFFSPATPPTQTTSHLFTQNFPADEKFRQELDLLRMKGRLLPENEIAINQSISSTSDVLKMPPAILWCLLFQESRLNHLEGVQGDQGARGLGQFSHFSFYEVNHHLDRFSHINVDLMNAIFGKDIRPIQPLDPRYKNPSSYFYIPTAVVSSAAFLNNRYLQLKRILERNHVSYNSELLWLYASMAYNKGSRSVIAFWNDSRRRGGKNHLERMVSDPHTLYASVSDVKLLTRSLRKIWSGSNANHFAKELDIHMENLRSCAIEREGPHELK